MVHDFRDICAAGEPEGARPTSAQIMHRPWRCLLLEEKVLSEAQRACEEKYLMDIEQDDDAVK